MSKHPWRAQVDIAIGDTDPIMTVFMGTVFTDPDSGAQFVRQDVNDPVMMKLSELQSSMHLADPAVMETKHVEQKKAREAAVAAAEKQARENAKAGQAEIKRK